MKKLICFMLCISLLLMFSFGCVITSESSQGESIIESQSESEQETATQSESETQSEPIEEEKPSPKGILSLQEAFDLGVLTHEDLLNIAYHSGNAQLNEEVNGDFESSAKPEMTEDVVLDITNSLSYVFNYLDLIPNETTANDFSRVNCYAFVNNYYVVDYSCSYFDVTEDVKKEIVDGVKFEYTYPIKVIQQKKMFMVTEARLDYYEWYIKVIFPNSTQDRVGIMLYGIFDNCLIGKFKDTWGYLQYGNYKNVLGYEFWINSGEALWLWEDGEFYGLDWAYENGMITIETIAKVHEVYSTGKGEYYE